MRGVFDFQAYQRQSASLPIVSHHLAQQLRSGPVEIGGLGFRCPTTQRNIASGIEMDRCTFERILGFTVRVNCQACRLRHEFKVANGSLEPRR
jgi:hypothetical protein